MVDTEPGTIGAVVLNTFFAALFIGSAWLFRYVAQRVPLVFLMMEKSNNH